MARFLVNSTLGVAGLFDVATMLGMKRTKTDAGQTIGMWAARASSRRMAASISCCVGRAVERA